MGLVTLWNNYLRWTQAVVVAPLIVGARRRWLKVAWNVVLITTTMAFLVQSWFLVVDYLAYPKTTNIRLINEPHAPFPALTFCNLNPFKKSMVHHSQELKGLLAAYTYVNKVKQARMANGTIATTTTSWTESHARMKRQAGATLDPAPSGCLESEAQYDAAAASDGSPDMQTYSIWNCSDETAFMDFGACGLKNLMRTKRFPVANLNSWKDDLLTIFYKCYYHFCTEGRCAMYVSGLDALEKEEDCLGNDGAYNPVLDGIVAQSLAYYCGYSDAACTLLKTGSKDSGYSYYTECGDKTTSVSEESTSASTVVDTTTEPSDSTFETTTASLTSATETRTTATGLLTTTTVAETTATQPVATTATVTTTSTPLASTTSTPAMTTATTTDSTSSSYNHGRTTATIKTSTITTDVQTRELTSTSETPATTTPLANAPTTTEMSTTSQVKTSVKPSSTATSTTTEKAGSASTSSSSTTAPEPSSTTFATTTETEKASSGSLLPSTTASAAVSSTSVTSGTTATTKSLAATPPTTGTSSSPQVTTTEEPTSVTG